MTLATCFLLLLILSIQLARATARRLTGARLSVRNATENAPVRITASECIWSSRLCTPTPGVPYWRQHHESVFLCLIIFLSVDGECGGMPLIGAGWLSGYAVTTLFSRSGNLKGFSVYTSPVTAKKLVWTSRSRGEEADRESVCICSEQLQNARPPYYSNNCGIPVHSKLYPLKSGYLATQFVHGLSLFYIFKRRNRHTTRLRGYAATRLRGNVPTRLRGYVATWLHGYGATWLHGYRARGYAATRLGIKNE